MKQTQSTLAWAAGLFEGEGAVHRATTKPRLSLKMTQEESVRRFAAIMAVGKIYGPYGPYAAQPKKAPFWTWIAMHEEAIEAASMLMPFASPWHFARFKEAGYSMPKF